VDQAVRNVITLILGFSACLSLFIWFVRESGHSVRLKKSVSGGLVAVIIAGLACLKIERVSGDLIPEFRFRWSASPDQLLPKVAAGGSEAAPWGSTADDFPRFLGPNGSGALDVPTLDPAWDKRSPEQLWRTPIGAGWSSFSTCGDHAVTLEQRGDEELVTCRSIATGNVTWSVAVRARHATVLGGVGPRSTPTIREGVVYATGATGWLHAIDGATGRVLWKKDVLADLGIDPESHAAAVAWGRSGSPLVTDGLVIVPGGGPFFEATPDGKQFVALVAYERASGERKWTAGTEQISYVTPELVRIADREVILAVNEARVVAYDPADGREMWGFDWPGHSNSDATCSQPHVLPDGKIFLSKGYGVGAALFAAAEGKNPPVYEAVWRQPGMLKTKFTNVVIHDGHAYGLSDGILECVRLSDGARQWKKGRYGQGQVLRVGAFLIVQAESGEIVLVDCVPSGHVERATLAALSSQTWNNPCVTGDRLLVRSAEEAACYRLPIVPAAGDAP
jgi:outer membrane protein assembly factor BamB